MAGFYSPAVKYALIVAMGGFLFGFDASVISGVVGFVRDGYALNDWQVGLLVSVPTLGGIIGASTVGPLSDRFGRKRLLLIVANLYLVSAVASTFAPTFELLLLARFIGGLGFASLGLAPIYIAEIAPADKRGRMISINQLNIVVGFSIAYFANYLLLQLSQSSLPWVSSLAIDSQTWRWMLGLEIVPACLFALLLGRVPESPRWLITNNHTLEARGVLAKLGAVDINAEIKSILSSSAAHTAPVIERLKEMLSPTMRMILLLGIFLAMIQQVTGINAIYFYAPTIFEQSGVGTDASFAQAIWVGIINVVFTVIAMSLIDRIGRKPLLIAGLTGIAVSMLICAIGFYQATFELTSESLALLSPELQNQLQPMMGVIYGDDVSFKQALSQHLGDTVARANQSELISAAININAVLILIGILGFVASFAVSLGPVMWVMLPEIFPNQLRGVAMAITGFANAMASFCVQFFFPWQLTNMGTAITFLNYGIFACLGLFVVLKFLPETRNQSLEELEQTLSAAAEGDPENSKSPVIKENAL